MVVLDLYAPPYYHYWLLLHFAVLPSAQWPSATQIAKRNADVLE